MAQQGFLGLNGGATARDGFETATASDRSNGRFHVSCGSKNPGMAVAVVLQFMIVTDVMDGIDVDVVRLCLLSLFAAANLNLA